MVIVRAAPTQHSSSTIRNNSTAAASLAAPIAAPLAAPLAAAAPPRQPTHPPHPPQQPEHTSTRPSQTRSCGCFQNLTGVASRRSIDISNRLDAYVCEQMPCVGMVLSLPTLSNCFDMEATVRVCNIPVCKAFYWKTAFPFLQGNHYASICDEIAFANEDEIVHKFCCCCAVACIKKYYYLNDRRDSAEQMQQMMPTSVSAPTPPPAPTPAFSHHHQRHNPKRPKAENFLSYNFTEETPTALAIARQ